MDSRVRYFPRPCYGGPSHSVIPDILGLSGCAASVAFLARASNLNAIYVSAYTDLICGLVADGVWPSIGALYIFATANVATATLNLVSTSFPITVHGSPTFTTGHGYTGTGNIADYLDTGYVPSTAGNMTLNSAAAMTYVLTNRVTNADTYVLGVGNIAGTSGIAIQSLNAGVMVSLLNDLTFGSVVVETTAKKCIVTTRTASGSYLVVRNADAGTTKSVTSTALPDQSIALLAYNQAGTILKPVTDQLAAAALSSGLTLTQARSLSNRVNAYMGALATPINIY